MRLMRGSLRFSAIRTSFRSHLPNRAVPASQLGSTFSAIEMRRSLRWAIDHMQAPARRVPRLHGSPMRTLRWPVEVACGGGCFQGRWAAYVIPGQWPIAPGGQLLLQNGTPLIQVRAQSKRAEATLLAGCGREQRTLGLGLGLGWFMAGSWLAHGWPMACRHQTGGGPESSSKEGPQASQWSAAASILSCQKTSHALLDSPLPRQLAALSPRGRGIS